MNIYEIVTKTQEELKEYCCEQLKNLNYKNIKNEDGFVYAEGNIPVLLVAHLDTVHHHQVTMDDIFVSLNGDKILSPFGIGGDDRCGIYMILKIAQELKCHILFCEDEERGCIGAGKFCKSDIMPNINFIIEFDRKNANDCVFYEDDNEKFKTFIESFGFKTDYGSFSDISEVAPYLKTSAVNLSCGYYNAHTTDEYVVLSEMEDVIQRSKSIIIQGINDNIKYDYIECVYNFYKKHDTTRRKNDYDFDDCIEEWDYSKYDNTLEKYDNYQNYLQVVDLNDGEFFEMDGELFSSDEYEVFLGIDNNLYECDEQSGDLNIIEANVYTIAGNPRIWNDSDNERAKFNFISY